MRKIQNTPQTHYIIDWRKLTFILIVIIQFDSTELMLPTINNICFIKSFYLNIFRLVFQIYLVINAIGILNTKKTLIISLTDGFENVLAKDKEN